MQFGNALHDRKPKSCTPLLVTIATPEAAKDKLPLLIRNTGTSISHSYCPAFLNDELDGRMWRSMFDGILCKIADGAFHHLGIAFDPYRLARAKQCDLSSLLKCQGDNVLNYLGTDSSRVRNFQRINRQRVELGNVEQLTDNPAHRFDIVMESLGDALIFQSIHACA